MPVETVNTIHDLVVTNPLIDDVVRDGQQHLSSVIKNAIRASFPAPGEQRWDNFQINTANGWTGTDPVLHNQPPLQGAVIPGMGGFFWRGGVVVPSTSLGVGTIIATFPAAWGPSELPVHDVACTMQGWVATTGTPSFISFGVTFTKGGEVKIFPPRVPIIGGTGEAQVWATNLSQNWSTSYLYMFGSGTCFR